MRSFFTAGILVKHQSRQADLESNPQPGFNGDHNRLDLEVVREDERRGCILIRFPDSFRIHQQQAAAAAERRLALLKSGPSAKAMICV